MLFNYITMHGEKNIKNANPPLHSAKPQVIAYHAGRLGKTNVISAS